MAMPGAMPGGYGGASGLHHGGPPPQQLGGHHMGHQQHMQHPGAGGRGPPQGVMQQHGYGGGQRLGGGGGPGGGPSGLARPPGPGGGFGPHAGGGEGLQAGGPGGGAGSSSGGAGGSSTGTGRKVPKGLEENVKRTIYVSYIDVMVRGASRGCRALAGGGGLGAPGQGAAWCARRGGLSRPGQAHFPISREARAGPSVARHTRTRAQACHGVEGRANHLQRAGAAGATGALGALACCLHAGVGGAAGQVLQPVRLGGGLPHLRRPQLGHALRLPRVPGRGGRAKGARGAAAQDGAGRAARAERTLPRGDLDTSAGEQSAATGCVRRPVRVRATARARVQALTLSGTILGGWPLRVQPSKTAIVPVSKHLMPRSQDEVSGTRPLCGAASGRLRGHPTCRSACGDREGGAQGTERAGSEPAAPSQCRGSCAECCRALLLCLLASADDPVQPHRLRGQHRQARGETGPERLFRASLWCVCPRACGWRQIPAAEAARELLAGRESRSALICCPGAPLWRASSLAAEKVAYGVRWRAGVCVLQAPWPSCGCWATPRTTRASPLSSLPTPRGRWPRSTARAPCWVSSRAHCVWALGGQEGARAHEPQMSMRRHGRARPAAVEVYLSLA